MSLAPGSRLGAYEVVSLLGEGGMGQVYRAKDTRLKRDVALKILPDAFAADPDRVARFQREAELLATLNHPNIAGIYGLEQDDGMRALVLELVEGPTLADRIAQGPISVEEALLIAGQIADALEAAHEKGVIHRDLKPANIKLTFDDKVKVLDFGLAKMLENPVAPTTLSMSPTLSVHATYAGVILGTATYMSPEQARGKAVDKRTDIWAFGCVLYETLTGKAPFQGEDLTEVLGAIIHKEIAWERLPMNTPATVRMVLTRCLEKDPKERMRDIGDVRLAMRGAFESPRSQPDHSSQKVVAPRNAWSTVTVAVASTLIIGTIAGLVAWNSGPSVSPPSVVRFPIILPNDQLFTNFGRQIVAISPEGSHIAYVANRRLHTRSFSEDDGKAVPGTESVISAYNPVFSPDGQWLAFYAPSDRTLKKVAVTGGALVTICSADDLVGMNWIGDNLLFAEVARGISRVSAAGGTPELLVPAEKGELLFAPQMLPDGDTMLFTVAPFPGTAPEVVRVVLRSKTGRRQTLIDRGADARYVPTGHIVYTVDGVILAASFDLRHLQLVGAPVPLIQGVARGFAGGVLTSAQFAVSRTGALVYIPGPVSTIAGERAVVALDRQGRLSPLKLAPAPYYSPRVSPDGKWLALTTDDSKESIIWLYDLAGTTSRRRLTFAKRSQYPVWSADSLRVAYQSDREGDHGIFVQRADGSGPVERLTKPDAGVEHIPQSWSPDGRTLLFDVSTHSTFSLWTLSISDKHAAVLHDVTSTTPTSAIFSPDGRWIAYNATERDTGGSGGSRVFVQPFPTTGAKYEIAGGVHPFWGGAGHELLFDGYGEMRSSKVVTQPNFAFGDPIPLSRSGLTLGGPAGPRNTDVVPNSESIIGLTAATDSELGPVRRIQVVLNWTEELKQRASQK